MDNKITGFEKHVILYAKGWYNKTKNPLGDLKRLLAYYAGIEIKYIANKDIYSHLISAFLKTMDPKTNFCIYSNAIAEMIGHYWGRQGSIKDRKPIHVLLGNISICGGEYVDLNCAFRNFTILDFDEQKERVQKVLDKGIKLC